MRAGPPGDRSAVASPLVVGAGWLAPALLALTVTFIYILAHGALLAWDGLIAAVAMMSVLALSVAIPRVINVSLLRTDGSSGAIVLLGHGSDAAMRPSVSPRRRTVAILAATASSASIAALALALSRGEQVLGYPHAIATLAFGANAALAARALIPIPGFVGWTLLLSLIEAGHPGESQLVLRASRIAKLLSIPVMLVVSLIGLLLGQPALTLPGILLGVLVWTQADLAETRDVVDRFLARRTADEVVRPLTAFLRADDPVRLSSATQPVVWMVVGPLGELLGFIGPRQLVRALAVIEQPVACRDAMAPVEMAQLLPPDAPASALLPPIARHGFAVVRSAEGLGYLESGDLARQARLWSTLEDRSSGAAPSTSPHGAEGGSEGDTRREP